MSSLLHLYLPGLKSEDSNRTLVRGVCQLPWELIKEQLDIIPDKYFKDTNTVLSIIAIDKAINMNPGSSIITYINERSANLFTKELIVAQWQCAAVNPNWFYRGALADLIISKKNRPSYDQWIIRKFILFGELYIGCNVMYSEICRVLNSLVGGYIVNVDGKLMIHGGSISFTGSFGSASISACYNKFIQIDQNIVYKYLKLLLPNNYLHQEGVVEICTTLARPEFSIITNHTQKN